MIKKPWVQSIIGLVVIFGILGGFIFWKSSSHQIKIDKSQINAPVINLGPTSSATLNEVYVNEGDEVQANTPLARVGTELITSKVAGQIVTVQKDIGKIFNPGETVISMINPQDIRVVGTIEEDKGLADIKVGQPVTFTVDTYGSEKFSGIVDEISPISNESGVVFNISDKRETKQFNIKVRFNQEAHPELKNGMSAKITIFTN